ncbi:MAG: polysaccharide deacetylase family protein [bacterium]|nr:polysaccharide deacetylase family protein [bacterium]
MKGAFLYLVAGLMLTGGGLVWVALYNGIQSSSAKPLFSQPKSEVVSEPFNQSESTVPSTSPSVYVPILMYHYIRDYQDRTDDPLGVQLSVSPKTFDKQLSILKNAGYQTISLEDFAQGKYQPKSVVLTFDDGYDDHYTNALPILEKYKATATFFIVSGFLGRTGYMTTPQVQQLKLAGMEVGGHTITHLNLANADYEKATKEISTSLRSRDSVFAYPSGKYNPVTLDIVSGLGVRAAVTTNLGVATEKSSLYELPRIRVKEHTDLLKRINEEIAVAKKQLSPSQRSKD